MAVTHNVQMATWLEFFRLDWTNGFLQSSESVPDGELLTTGSYLQSIEVADESVIFLVRSPQYQRIKANWLPCKDHYPLVVASLLIPPSRVMYQGEISGAYAFWSKSKKAHVLYPPTAISVVG